ncbi:uncharacterized protein ALTATR162_LOCUS6075 [Alternaria atra]|uniref:Uncharacterized protein n=1 Tax=Alternaria atra TaxID=119953 RepID=A0A8J2N0G5_9PLEO|nr:uncharacterized protein ALTATR162_LOCUS6075 [Alternaria atra]CAG5161692.1 unnamed protein product [Alternaria atra]
MNKSPRTRFYEHAVSSHSDATSFTNSIPPKLAQVLPRLRTPSITPAWITISLIPTMKVAYGSAITQTEFDDGTWSNAIEKTDLLIQAMDRANDNKAFTQTYYEALWMRNRDLDEGVTAMEQVSEGSDAEFCEILADQGGDFTIAVLMVLRTMEDEVDSNENGEAGPSRETGERAEKNTKK